MKINKIIRNSIVLSFLSLLITLTYQVNVDAQADTKMSILITKPELYIESVQPIKFDEQTEKSEAYNITSSQDLVIKIVDNRESTSAWSLKYGLTMFEKETNQALGNQIILEIGSGILTNTNGSDVSGYEAKKATIDLANDNESSILLLPDSEESEYIYRIKGEDIHLEIPAKAAVGEYVATESVTLVNTPESE